MGSAVKRHIGNEIDVRMDLEWLFNDAVGDLGLSSAHGAMVAMIEGGAVATVPSSSGAEERMERSFDAAERYRRVAGGVAALPLRQQLALQAAFTRRRWPAALLTRPVTERHAACSSEAVRSFLKSLGAARWSLSAAEAWLVRAERPTKDMGVPVEALTALRLAAWAEAEAAVGALLSAYATAVAAWADRHHQERVRRLRGAA